MSTAKIQEEPYKWKKLIVWGPEDMEEYRKTHPRPSAEELAKNEAYQRAINGPVLSDEAMAEWEDAVAYARSTFGRQHEYN